MEWAACCTFRSLDGVCGLISRFIKLSSSTSRRLCRTRFWEGADLCVSSPSLHGQICILHICSFTWLTADFPSWWGHADFRHETKTPKWALSRHPPEHPGACQISSVLTQFARKGSARGGLCALPPHSLAAQRWRPRPTWPRSALVSSRAVHALPSQGTKVFHRLAFSSAGTITLVCGLRDARRCLL